MKKLICKILIGCIVLTTPTAIFAAGRTAGGYKNNTYEDTADATSFLNGITSNATGYSTEYKEASDVTKNHFYDKSKTIKYWASHGKQCGTLYGDANTVRFNIYDRPPSSYGSSFKWSGSNLEFAFVAACFQLGDFTNDPVGKNNRAKYAKAMIGSNAVRVIAGYHASAPARKGDRNIDEEVARKFFDYAKTGESAKSSWMKANNYFTDNDGYSTGYNFCVLTHAGDVQYSRFEGFPGRPYARPGSSSTSILRFSRVNPGGTPQPYSAKNASPLVIDGLSFVNDIDAAIKMSVPDYFLKATSSKINVKEDAKVMVLRDGKVVSTTSGEIGDEAVKFTEDDAIAKAKKWLLGTYERINIDNNKNKLVEVSPIVMAEVDLNGNSENEIEQTIAYVVKFTNTYKNIPVVNNFYSAIVDNKGINASSTNWSEFDEVKVSKRAIGFEEAVKIASGKLSQNSDDNISKTVRNTELVFAYNNDLDAYEPTWVFKMNDNMKLEVNCFNGEVIIKR